MEEWKISKKDVILQFLYFAVTRRHFVKAMELLRKSFVYIL